MTMTKTPHYHLLNLLKICALVAIQVFHTAEFLFFEDTFTMGGGTFLDFMIAVSRVFTLGGQILIALIFFLFGFHQKSRSFLFKVAGFSLIGQCVLLAVFMEGSILQSIEWDIYSFLFFTVLLLAVIPPRLRSSLSLIIPTLLLCLVPVSVWQEGVPLGIFFDILTGRLSANHSASWAPLPWMAFAFLFTGLGALAQGNLEKLRHLGKREVLLWIIFLGWTLPWLGAYYPTPLGMHFYDFSFNKPSWIFWANFLPFVFWMRIALLQNVQDWTESKVFFRWLSSLMWIRKVGMTYLVGVMYLGVGSFYSEQLRATPIYLDLYFLGLMPISEMVVRVFTASLSGVRRRSGKVDSSAS